MLPVVIPLCPNCHLNDQHNPTQIIDKGLLKLFRNFKNPYILRPQFTPIFERMSFLLDESMTIAPEMSKKGEELAKFILNLEMGSYYAEKIKHYTSFHRSPRIHPLDGPRIDYSSLDREDLKTYCKKINKNRHECIRLIIEQLRYQKW